jgi:hypothetical protein
VILNPLKLLGINSPIFFAKLSSKADLECAFEDNFAKKIGELIPNNLSGFKIGHHGSKDATSQEFLSTLKPQIAFISCGHDTGFKLPHEMVISRLYCENAVTKVFLTNSLPRYGVPISGKINKSKVELDKLDINTSSEDKSVSGLSEDKEAYFSWEQEKVTLNKFEVGSEVSDRVVLLKKEHIESKCIVAGLNQSSNIEVNAAKDLPKKGNYVLEYSGDKPDIFKVIFSTIQPPENPKSEDKWKENFDAELMVDVAKEFIIKKSEDERKIKL